MSPEYVLDEDNKLFFYKPYSQTLEWIHPADFLEMVHPTSETQEWLRTDSSHDWLVTKMREGAALEPLFLDVDLDRWKVTSHEGRHRAVAAIELEIVSVPVIFYHMSKGEHSFEGYQFVREVAPYKDGPYYGTHEEPFCCRTGHVEANFAPQF